MTHKLLAGFALAVGVLAFFSPLFAHHGTAAYETTKKTTVKGTVTDFQFMNPHTEITVEMKDDQGNAERWECEAGSANLLARMGWSKTILKPGDEITVTGYRAKNGSNVLRLVAVTLPNGQTLDATGIPEY